MQASAPWTHTAYGVDGDQDRLFIVKATRHGRQLTFCSATAGELSSGGAVAACVLQRESFAKWLTAALSSVRKAEKVFPSLLDVQLPFSVEDCQYALVDTRSASGRPGIRGLAVGARSADIEKRLSALRDAGVEPHVLDQESLALWSQALEEHPITEGGQPLRAVLYLGSERVTLAMGQGDEFLGAHSLRQFDPEQIVRLARSYAPAGVASLQWLCAGPLAADPVAVERGRAALGTRWPGSTLSVARDPAGFLPRALATRALTAGASRCNLRAGRFLHPLYQQQAAQAPFRLAAGLLAAGLLLVTVNLAWAVVLHRMLAHARNTVQTLAIEIAGTPRLVPKGQEVLGARRALELRSRQLEPFLASVEAPLPAVLGTALAAGQIQGITFEALTLNRNTLAIHGRAANWGQCEQLAGRLRRLASTVKTERKEGSAADTRIAFVLSMELAREK